jgi:Predicted glycosyltransferases
MTGLLLHKEYLLRVPLVGGRMAHHLEQRSKEVRQQITQNPISRDIGITVLVRTQNDAGEIGIIMEDIRANQEYFAGKVQVVLVDTESSDGTVEIALKYRKFFEVTVVPIKQQDFSYPKSLNIGFEAAKYDLVFTLVGHSALVSKLTLAAIAQHAGRPEVGGAFCYPMPNANATVWERLVYGFTSPARMIAQPAKPIRRMIMGTLGANCSVVKRQLWKEFGGYDERYGAGGEEASLARAMLAAGYKIYIDPMVTVHHSHGLGLVASLRQYAYWKKLAKPRAFSRSALAKFRPDLRETH